MGVQEPNLNAHPSDIEKGREHVARFDGHKGEEIGTFIPGRDDGRIGPHDDLIQAAFGDPGQRGPPAEATTVTRFLLRRRVRRLALITGY